MPPDRPGSRPAPASRHSPVTVASAASAAAWPSSSSAAAAATSFPPPLSTSTAARRYSRAQYGTAHHAQQHAQHQPQGPPTSQAQHVASSSHDLPHPPHLTSDPASSSTSPAWSDPYPHHPPPSSTMSGGHPHHPHQYPSPSPHPPPLHIDTGPRQHHQHWQDEGRRKSIKLANGTDADGGGVMSLPLSQWQWPGAQQQQQQGQGQGGGGDGRRLSAVGDLQQHGGGFEHHQLQQQQQGHDGSPGSTMLPSPVGTSAHNSSAWPPPAAHLSHFYPSLPNPFATSVGGSSGDGTRPGSAAAAAQAASAYPTPYTTYTGLPPTGSGLPPSYAPYGGGGGSGSSGGAPSFYTPTGTAFPPHAYTPMFSHSSSSAIAAFASTSSSFSHPQSLVSPHSSAYPQQQQQHPQHPQHPEHQQQHAYVTYVTSPSAHLPPTSTIPPHVTLGGYSGDGGLVGAASTGDSPTSPTFPIDASTPYIPPDPTAPTPPCVLVAAANRDKLGPIDLTGHSRTDDVSARRPSTAQSSRRAVDLVYECQNCRRKIGRLTLRGGSVDKAAGDNPSKYLGVFYCTQCVAPPPSSANGLRPDGLNGGTMAYATEATYHDTLSAAVDRFQGIDPKLGDSRPPPAPPGKVRSGFTAQSQLAGSSTGMGGVGGGGGGGGGGSQGSKKRRASVVEESEGLLACDVCRRDLATGSLQLAATGEPVGATIEVLCAHCESRYTRCSDCGGGGGSKGVGRWRCTQLFPPGRRTCMLLHTRVGTVNEMDYDVWPISTIPNAKRPELIDLCKDLYYTNLLGTLGVPDMLESVCPIARSFTEVEKLCVDSWTTYEPFMIDDVEPTNQSRRYIALRWVRPSSRKKRNKKGSSGNTAEVGAQSSPEENKMPLPASPLFDGSKGDVPLIREGKVLTGFILAELDLNVGNLHVAITLPTGAGESYDASTRLLQTLVARVHEDLAATNAHRTAMQLPRYPPLTTAWTMHMTKRDSRIMSRLETRRGFIPLEDFLVKFPESDPKHFPPQRPAYLPPEFLRGWQVYAKRLTADDLPPSNSGSFSSTSSSGQPSIGSSTSSFARLPVGGRRASMR
ncbi:hypothetical protein JCM3775_006504 [Rhodotorula graminis]